MFVMSVLIVIVPLFLSCFLLCWLVKNNFQQYEMVVGHIDRLELNYFSPT